MLSNRTVIIKLLRIVQSEQCYLQLKHTVTGA